MAIQSNLLLAVLIQGDELQLLAGLASDAAGLLWELAAMHDTGDAATDMLTKSEQLQVWHLLPLCSSHVMLICTIAIAVRSQVNMGITCAYPHHTLFKFCWCAVYTFCCLLRHLEWQQQQCTPPMLQHSQHYSRKPVNLQAQLRGMISDFTDADESAIAAALGAFETLTNSLDEFKKSDGGGAQEVQLPASTRTSTASAGGLARLQPPPGGSGSQAPGQKPADEAPLISFD